MKKVKGAGKCIFCGGPRMSKEHIWSDWLTKRGAIPSQSSHNQLSTLLKFDPNTSKAQLDIGELISKEGPLIQRKIRRVCVPCNSGWMRDIVNAAIPYAEKAVTGQFLLLDERSQLSLSAWISICCVMAEFTDEKTRVIPHEHLKHIKNEGLPPFSWRIFIGQYDGIEWSPARYRHHSVKGQEVDLQTLSIPNNEITSWQISTYTLGKLAVQIASFSSYLDLDHFDCDFKPDNMCQIWPITADQVLTALPEITDVDLAILSDAFYTSQLTSGLLVSKADLDFIKTNGLL